MPTDYYKGLTIKLGADTSSLQYALKHVRTAARETQGSLRKINNALSVNPANIVLINEKFNTLSKRAAIVGAQLGVMRQSVKQFAAENPNLARQAEITKNIGLRVRAATEQYNSLNAAIASTRDKLYALANISAEEREMFGVKECDEFAASLASTNPRIAELVKRLKELQSGFGAAEKELSDSNKIRSFLKAQQDIKILESEARDVATELAKVHEDMLRLGTSRGIQKANEKLKRTDLIAEDVEKQIRDIQTALDLNPGKMSLLINKFASMRDRVEVCKRKVDELTDAQSRLVAKIGSMPNDPMSKLSDDYQRAKRQYTALTASMKVTEGEIHNVTNAIEMMKNAEVRDEAEIKRMEEELEKLSQKYTRLVVASDNAKDKMETAFDKRRVRELANEISIANARLKSLGKSAMATKENFSSLAYGARTVGMGLSASISTATQLTVTRVASAADSIDSSFRDMKKTVNGTVDQFDELKQAAIEYSTTHFTSADKILEIQAIAGQLGIAVENLEEFSTTVSNLDIATDMDAEDIAISLGKLVNIIDGLEVENVDKFADSLVRLGNNNAALESDIMNITTRFAAMGNQVGMNADEILAWATVATETGVKAESAGSNMQKTLGNINSAVAKGGDKLNEYAEIMGMSADEIKKKWGDGHGGTTEVFENFIKGLSKLDGTQIDKTLQDLKIGSVRQRQLIEGLTQSVGGLDDALKMSENAWNGVADEWGNGGDAAYEAQQKSEGFSGALAIMKNNASALASTMGEDLVPLMKDASSAIKTLTGWYESLSDSEREMIVKVGLVSSAIGPLLVLFGTTAQGIIKLHDAMNMGKTGAAMLAGKLKSLKTGLGTTADAANEAKVSMDKAFDSTSSVSKTNTQVIKTSKSVNGYRMNLDKVAKSSKAAGKAQDAMGASTAAATLKAGLQNAAIMAGVAAIVLLISKVVEYVEDQKELEKALSGTNDVLADFNSSLGAVQKVSTGSFGAGTVKSLSEIKKGTDSTIESINSFKDSLSSSFTDASASIEQLNGYWETIKKFSKDGATSSESLAELKIAIAGVNDACGTSYEIDSETGRIKNQGEEVKKVNKEFKKLIETKKLSLQQDAISSNMTEALKAKNEAAANLADAQATLSDLETKLAEAEKNRGTLGGDKAYEALQSEYADALAEVEKATQLYGAQSESVENLTGKLTLLQIGMDKGSKSREAWLSNASLTSETLARNGQDALEFNNALEAMGVKYGDLKRIGDDTLSGVADKFDGTVGSIAESLKELGISFDLSSTSAETMAKVIRKSVGDNMPKSFKKALKSSGLKLSEFITQMEGFGATTENIASITSEQWQLILKTSGSDSKKAAELVKKWAEVNEKYGSEAGSALAEGVSDGAKDAKSSLEAAGKEGKDAYTAVFESENLEPAGLAIATGLADGTISPTATAKMRAAAKSIVAEYISGVKGSLSGYGTNTGSLVGGKSSKGSSSSSKKTESLSTQSLKTMSTDLANAIDKSSVSAYKSMTSSVNEVMGNVTKAMSTMTVTLSADAGEGAGSTTNNYVVNGVTLNEGTDAAACVKGLTKAMKMGRRSNGR